MRNIIKIYKFIHSTGRLFSIKMSQHKIGTHCDKFHCDDVLACFMLKLLPEYKNAEIIRTRDLSILEKCDIVVDVGGKYDPQTHRYDHHMKLFKETFSTVLNNPKYKSNIKLSSAGLIYCHFGQEIIKQLCPELNQENIEIIFKEVYETFIKEIDALDNGIPMTDKEPLYRIVTDLSSRVARLNPKWNTPDLNQDTQFTKAMDMVGEEFTNCVKDYVYEWLPCKLIIQEAIENRFQIDSSGQIIKLNQMCPWKEHLFNIEQELNIESTIMYVIFGINNYKIQGVPVTPSSFILRKRLPEKWGGLVTEELSKVCGIKDCIFVHSNGFIGENKTEEGALEMARKALKM